MNWETPGDPPDINNTATHVESNVVEDFVRESHSTREGASKEGAEGAMR